MQRIYYAELLPLCIRVRYLDHQEAKMGIGGNFTILWE